MLLISRSHNQIKRVHVSYVVDDYYGGNGPC